MWVYRSGHLYKGKQIILYEYQLTRNASHPRQFLKDFAGICVTDGYQVCHTLEKEKEELTIAGCWVHCRRRFNDALNTIPKPVRKNSESFLLMKQIQTIYREEGKLADDRYYNGAKASAIIYSIAETAKANNLKPYDYVRYLLEEITKHMNDTDLSFIKNLLPWSENLPAGIRKS